MDDMAPPGIWTVQDRIINALESFTPASDGQAALQRAFLATARAGGDLTHKDNLDGHFTVKCVMLHPGRKTIAIRERHNPDEWDLPSAHFTRNGPVSSLKRELVRELQMPTDSFDLLLARPIYLTEEESRRGIRPPHIHRVLVYIIQSKTGRIRPRTFSEPVSWIEPATLPGYLGPRAPQYAELATALASKLG